MILLDRNIPKPVATGLKCVRPDVRWLTDVPELRDNTPDAAWLQYVGIHDWVAVTRDERIRYRSGEIAAAKKFDVGLFVLGSHGNKTKWVTFRTVVCHLDEMIDIWDHTPRPFIYIIYEQGPMRKIPLR